MTARQQREKSQPFFRSVLTLHVAFYDGRRKKYASRDLGRGIHSFSLAVGSRVRPHTEIRKEEVRCSLNQSFEWTNLATVAAN
mmetsp:Transcript_27067/g.74649  ORF Transcript_27067/g.74649 Transcript_27067/m.74649 type:complete len:83 (+) Transcript_27067:891-1139(+)